MCRIDINSAQLYNRKKQHTRCTGQVISENVQSQDVATAHVKKGYSIPVKYVLCAHTLQHLDFLASNYVHLLKMNEKSELQRCL